jgi:hypothetical protein
VLGQHPRVPVAQLFEQPRRSLDIREEERDGPSRELSHKPGLRLPSGAVKCDARDKHCVKRAQMRKTRQLVSVFWS